MKQKIIEILSVKMRATVDEDHEPFVYGHEETANLIIDFIKKSNTIERDKAIDLLDECRLQLEYLQQKFGETGSGNNILSRVNTFLEHYNKK